MSHRVILTGQTSKYIPSVILDILVYIIENFFFFYQPFSLKYCTDIINREQK